MLKSCCCCCCFMLHNVRPPNINVLCCLPSSRYEGRIVQQMIRNDGGKGDYTEVTPPMLGIWETVLAVGSCPLLICCILSPVMQIINRCKGCKTLLSLQTTPGSCKYIPAASCSWSCKCTAKYNQCTMCVNKNCRHRKQPQQKVFHAQSARVCVYLFV